MDVIFRKTTGWFDVVKSAKEEPHWHDKNGETIISYEDTDIHRRMSAVSAKPGAMALEDGNHTNPTIT